MKKHLVLAAIMIGSFFASIAQDNEIVIQGSKPTTMQATPKQIIDSLKKRFPNATAVQYYHTPASAVKSGWVVNEEDDLDPAYDQVDYYTLKFKRSDFQYYALFKADGTLVNSKYQENGAKLPEAVKTSIKQLGGGDYKDYTLQSKTYYKFVNHGKKKEYYELTGIKKSDNSKKKITIDPTGKVIKVS